MNQEKLSFFVGESLHYRRQIFDSESPGLIRTDARFFDRARSASWRQGRFIPLPSLRRCYVEMMEMGEISDVKSVGYVGYVGF